MKFVLIKILILIIIFSAFGAVAYANADISLYVDNEKLNPDVLPMIVNDRTLVPIRCIFEKLNANVQWVDSTNQVVITSNDSVLTLKINDKTAYVNNNPVALDASPVIVNGRTMVPVRFITENLGYSVFWNDETKSVYISSPVKPDINEKNICIADVKTEKSGDSCIVTIKADNFEKPSITTASSPARYILDFKNAYISGGDSKTKIGDKNITEVRWADHADYARIVIESPGKAEYKCNYYNGYMTITVTGEKTDNTVDENIDNSIVVKVDKPIIIIDAGHGGKDTGAIGYNEDGEAELYEKEANLKIALKVQSYLQKSGVSVVMTRSTDVMLGNTEMEDLLKRAEIANNAKGTFFVSIHNNSFTDPSASGTLVLYADSDTKINYGVTSNQIAKNILNPLVDAMGILNRGVVNSPNMVVLKKTKMPSVLIECGFVSCPEDRKILSDDKKTDDIATAIAKGILKSISQLP